MLRKRSDGRLLHRGLRHRDQESEDELHDRDDPMYFWTAKHIVEHPVDFYGLNVNWIQFTESMAVANKNPRRFAYGVDPAGASSFSLQQHPSITIEAPWIGLSFLGGTCLPALLVTPWTFGRLGSALTVVFLFLGVVAPIGMKTLGHIPLRTPEGPRWGLVLQLALFMLSGALIFALVLRHVVRCRSAEAILLALWVCGIFVFGSLVNWSKKAADIIGLHLNPPAHAAVFCVDEKTAIQALDRKDPVLPLSPEHAEWRLRGFLPRHILSLCGLRHAAGEVLGKTAARHTSAEFVSFLADLVVHQPRDKEIHVIADNLSAHKTAQVAEFLERHPSVHLHFIPTYSSWLNQVELLVGKIERDVIARGVFTSVPDLRRKLMKYIRNKTPKTVSGATSIPLAASPPLQSL